MANVLKMATIHSIIELRNKGWSVRRIARELGVHRNTVTGYLADLPSQNPSKCTISTPGDPPDQTSKCSSSPPRPSGRPSACKPYESFILSAIEKGLSAQRIYQDLKSDHQFKHSYQSVKRFVRRLRCQDPQRVWRMECEPGEEIQVDYGSGFWLIDPQNKRKRKVHVLRCKLSFSRKAFSQAFVYQTTEHFIRGLEGAFRNFGGVAKTLCLDNLKAAVHRCDWFDYEINPKFRSFCQHYQIAVIPTRPYQPEHKGKIESGIKYVKANALKGRQFGSLPELNGHLQQWENQIADSRIHGTTRIQVRAAFEQIEKPCLQPLPPDLFPLFEEATRSVHRDSYVEVKRAYYQVPAEYVGRQVVVRWDPQMVRIYTMKMEPISSHRRLELGQFSRCLGAQGLPRNLEKSLIYWVNQASTIGPAAVRWADELSRRRGLESIRTLQGLSALAQKHSSDQVDAACAQALITGVWKLKPLRQLIGLRTPSQTHFGFLESHPLIRDLSEYGAYLHSPQTNKQNE